MQASPHLLSSNGKEIPRKSLHQKVYTVIIIIGIRQPKASDICLDFAHLE